SIRFAFMFRIARRSSLNSSFESSGPQKGPRLPAILRKPRERMQRFAHTAPNLSFIPTSMINLNLQLARSAAEESANFTAAVPGERLLRLWREKELLGSRRNDEAHGINVSL